MPTVVPIVRVRGRNSNPSVARIADRLQQYALEVLEDAQDSAQANEALLLLDTSARLHGRTALAYEVERILRGAA